MEILTGEKIQNLIEIQSESGNPISNYEETKAAIVESLSHISDNEIINSWKCPITVKAYALRLKHTDGFDSQLIASKIRIIADVIKVSDSGIYIDGRTRIELLPDGYSFYITDQNGKKYDLEYYDAVCFDFHGLDGQIAYYCKGFHAELPAASGSSYRFVMRNPKGEEKTVSVHGRVFSNLSTTKRSYTLTEKHIVSYEDNCILVEEKSFLKEKSLAFKFNAMLKKNNRSDIIRIRKNAKALKKGKPIWLIYDRSDKGDDNGEALFKYLMKAEAARDLDIRYCISAKSHEYKRVSQYGPVCDIDSEEFKTLFLASERVISSQWAMWALNPFGEDYKYVQDMFKYKFVFLQHGITKDDLSVFGHKLKRNLSMFVTAVNDEYNSIIDGNYQYDSSIVKLTGFPRFDTLTNECEKLVLVMPSWRGNMKLEPEMTKSGYKYLDTFKESEYYKFYNGLINDEKLLNVMREKGYKGAFCIHPNFAKQTGDFLGNDIFQIKEIPFNYQEMFRKGAIMVTDYSSTAFDFAYMKKPIIYSQYDRETFYEGHPYSEGYFSYENNGFGPVCTDYESTRDALVEYVRNDCVQPPEYINRVEQFFAFTDRNNCQRVYEEIRGL